ncbi:tRNA (adenosine(37)-N6)-threonylcarbamoyltransferase complex ATPase subunit type 1 TsaE [Carnimonas nigrificans]|uniref:tRNA (adenosine(37)-N6)-threonylcarbamoyltransferase complex ATPase subunit type 1 TsaE n=1 Tax=Carnimonas nigrificans TaxID=64323 RepID=UPI000471A92A|nr:tRNA (adenosine(37)-N6)-threonylcarbamoyltransferase complex ATPase subunit type 1 TsaE [Carnimonas nigrificans]
MSSGSSSLSSGVASLECTLRDENAQIALGRALGHALDFNGCVFLEGELGAGKTTLTRGVLRGAGFNGAVKSPTYTLLEPYNIAERRIYHFDLYRLADPEELEFIGARDLFKEKGLYLVEWPSRGEGGLPAPDLRIHIDVLESGRKACITAYSDAGARAVAALDRTLSEAE